MEDKEKSKKGIKFGTLGKLILGGAITGYLLIGQMGEYRPWKYGDFFRQFDKIEKNYDNLFKGCKDKNDSIDLYQELRLEEDIKLKNPSIDEKVRVLSEYKSIEDTLRD